MKKLVSPMIVLSFLLTATTVVPGIPWYCGALGASMLFATYVAGIMLLGVEDKDWSAMIHKLDLDRQAIESTMRAWASKSDAQEKQVSTALASLRSERRQGPLE